MATNRSHAGDKETAKNGFSTKNRIKLVLGLTPTEAEIKFYSETLTPKKVVQLISCMKNKFKLCTMAVGILLAGCVTGKSGVVLDAVGPAVTKPDAVHARTGTLTVYSAFDVNADFNSRDPDRAEYSNYRIYSQDGKLLQRVQNDTGSNFNSPAEVSLAPGKYRVVAHANGYGMVTVPVVVAENRVTTVHLEGGSSSDTARNDDQNEVVRLPDGVVVGSRTAE
jgi:hypothetical protein